MTGPVTGPVTAASLAPVAAFAAVDVVLCLTPGPAVLFVVAQALGHGVARSVWATAGVLAGDALYLALSACGVGALLVATPNVFHAVQYAGAAYLVALGVATYRGRGLAIPAHAGARLGTDRADHRTATRAVRGMVTLARGFATQAANPKALLVFTALLPQFVRPGAAAGRQVAVLGVLSVAIECVVLLGYGALAGRAAPALRRPRVARVVDRATGSLLVAAGAGTAVRAAV